MRYFTSVLIEELATGQYLSTFNKISFIHLLRVSEVHRILVFACCYVSPYREPTEAAFECQKVGDSDPCESVQGRRRRGRGQI